MKRSGNHYPILIVKVPAPVNNLESESSESDVSSYSFNYESDSSVAANGPIYPILLLANYPDNEDNPEDDINWDKNAWKTMCGVFLLYHFLDQVVNSTSF